ncbi:hypothetical protein OUZ56_012291 [Daphnia magna]|uniref:Uncharacterized protein n=1 Tax=Daphnia magna TaxID=35525 RepID=A0ABQ9Z2V2_9CRUS|nr:hypothetical protein OUZ56_012291 [Daphnia magna]
MEEHYSDVESISSEELNQMISFWNSYWHSYYEDSLIRQDLRQGTPWHLISFGDLRYQNLDPDDPVYIVACKEKKEAFAIKEAEANVSIEAEARAQSAAAALKQEGRRNSTLCKRGIFPLCQVALVAQPNQTTGTRSREKVKMPAFVRIQI